MIWTCSPTLSQRCNFDVFVWTSLRLCVMVVRICDLTTLFHRNTKIPRKTVLKKALSLHKKWRFPLKIWSHSLKKSLIENFIFCAVFLKFGKVLPKLLWKNQKEIWVKHEINPPLQRHFNNLAHILRNFAISSEILKTYFTPGHFFAKGLNLPYLSKQKGWSDGAGGPVKSWTSVIISELVIVRSIYHAKRNAWLMRFLKI